MEENKQTIKCTVESCKFNDCNRNLCELQQIKVEPCSNCQNGRAEEESMCGSYSCKCK